MRTVLISISFIAIALNVKAKERFFCSSNEQYKLGVDYDLNCAKLYDNSGAVLWERNVVSIVCQFPLITDKGITIFPGCKDVMAVSVHGDLMFNFPPASFGQINFHHGMEGDCICGTTRHKYCDDDGSYLLIYKQDSDNTTKLVNLNRAGSILWNYDFGQYSKYRQISPTFIQTTKDRIIVDDFNNAGFDYVNRCFLLDRISGKLIRTLYGKPTALPFTDGDTLYICQGTKGDEVVAYDVISGKPLCTVHPSDVISWLYEENNSQVLFALMFIGSDLLPLDNKAKKRIENLAKKHSERCLNFSIYYLTSLSKQILERNQQKQLSPTSVQRKAG